MFYHLAVFEEAEDIYDYALRESHVVFHSPKGAADSAYRLALTLPDNQYACVSDSQGNRLLEAFPLEPGRVLQHRPKGSPVNFSELSLLPSGSSIHSSLKNIPAGMKQSSSAQP